MSKTAYNISQKDYVGGYDLGRAIINSLIRSLTFDLLIVATIKSHSNTMILSTIDIASTEKSHLPDLAIGD